MSLSRDIILEEYTTSRTSQYEFESRDTWQSNRMEAINQYFGAMNSRMYSANLANSGMNLKAVQLLNHVRFDSGEGDIIGRDIVWKYGIDSRIVGDMVYRLTMANNGNIGNNVIEFAIEGGDTYLVRFTETGKRTYRGKPSDGMMKIKHHAPKQYKRNRKSNW